jgi:hypothetical protein
LPLKQLRTATMTEPGLLTEFNNGWGSGVFSDQAFSNINFLFTYLHIIFFRRTWNSSFRTRSSSGLIGSMSDSHALASNPKLSLNAYVDGSFCYFDWYARYPVNSHATLFLFYHGMRVEKTLHAYDLTCWNPIQSIWVKTWRSWTPAMQEYTFYNIIWKCRKMCFTAELRMKLFLQQFMSPNHPLKSPLVW